MNVYRKMLVYVLQLWNTLCRTVCLLALLKYVQKCICINVRFHCMYVRKRKWQCAIQDSLPPAQDESFLIDCQSAILHCLSLPALAVRVQASWALANFTDPLPFSPHPTLKHSLYSATTRALRDADKVRCNGVRAAGNLLKDLTEKGNGGLET